MRGLPGAIDEVGELGGQGFVPGSTGTRKAVRRCRLLIAVSESTKSDLVALYGVAPERVRVVPLGGGEPSIVPVPAAIANAIFDAIGVRLREIPFTPDRVLRALKA